MKKIIGLACTVIMILTMGMSVFAAGSSTVQETKETSVQVNADGTKSAVVESVTGTKVAVVAPAVKTVSTQGVVTSASIATGSGAVLAFTDAAGKKIANVTMAITAAPETVIDRVLSGATTGTTVKAADIVAAVEVEVSGFSGGSATIPLSVSGVVKGESVYGIHFKTDGTVEYIPAVVSANGIVNITTTSFSPIIIVKGQMPATAASNAATSAASGSSDTTSPKTGEQIPAALVLAVFCLAGAALCAKKLSYSK